jgi:hypothetical protein
MARGGERDARFRLSGLAIFAVPTARIAVGHADSYDQAVSEE